MKTPYELISTLIGADETACQSLLDSLLKERQALTTRNRQDLSESVEAKSQALNKLAQNAELRRQLLLQQKRDNTEAAWQELLRQQPNASEGINCLDRWKKLQLELAHIKQENDINGRLLQRGRSVLERLLTLVRGKPEVKTSLYDRSGTAKSSSYSQTVAEA